MGSRERDTQNQSVTLLIDNNAQDESNLVLNKQSDYFYTKLDLKYWGLDR